MMMVVKQLCRGALKDSSPGCQLIDHDGQCILIGGWSHMDRGCQGRVIELFGSHIEWCADGTMQGAPMAIECRQSKIGEQEMWPTMRKNSGKIRVVFCF